MKLSHIVSASLISMAAFGCQKEFQLPPLFQQREIKGNHAGQQILAMGMLRQCMRHEGFRQYAQERVRSETTAVLRHIMGHATPSCLSEDGEIPQDRLISTNGVGPCSLSYYKGKFNIKRKGQIKRIPACNVDSTLSQLDEKTMNHYLSLAKISMSRCSDDSIMLRSHLDLKGGSWQFLVFNNLMAIIQGGSRIIHAITIREGIHNLTDLASRAFLYMRGGVVETVRPHLSETGIQMARGLEQALNGVAGGAISLAQQYGSTPVETITGMAQTAGQALVEHGIEVVRGTAQAVVSMPTRETVQTVMGNDTAVGHLVNIGGQWFRQLVLPGGETLNMYATAADILHNQFPEATREIAQGAAATATSWAWLYNLLEFTFQWRF